MKELQHLPWWGVDAGARIRAKRMQVLPNISSLSMSVPPAKYNLSAHLDSSTAFTLCLLRTNFYQHETEEEKKD